MERFGVPKNIVGVRAADRLQLQPRWHRRSTCRWPACSWRSWPASQLTLGQQLMMMLTLMLASKGVAGVPRAALVVLAATLTQFGLPLEGAAILLGIDQIMDMGRTAVNVMGNCIATAVVARWEGVFDDERMRAFADGAGPGPPDADRGGRRARPARRGDRPRMRGRPRGRRVRRAPSSTSPTTRRWRRRWRASQPDVDHQLRRVTTTSTRAEDHPVDGAERQRASPSARWRARPRRTARRSSTTAPTSCSTARPTAPYTETDRAESAERVRRVEAARRVVRRRRAARLRAARREPVRPRAGRRPAKGSVAGDPERAAGRRRRAQVFDDRTVSPTYVVDAARATRQLARDAARRPASITA